jgi:uncharacterized cupin superfamily protein
VNIYDSESAGERIDVAGAVGYEASAMYLYDLAPGRSSCPYHYEYEEEWLLVVVGAVVVRTPDGERTLTSGDPVCFPPGPAGAHKIMNRSSAPARTLAFSSSRLPAVSVYPDSNTIGVWPGDDTNELVFRRDTVVQWSDREDGWENAD